MAAMVATTRATGFMAQEPWRSAGHCDAPFYRVLESQSFVVVLM